MRKGVIVAVSDAGAAIIILRMLIKLIMSWIIKMKMMLIVLLIITMITTGMVSESEI